MEKIKDPVSEVSLRTNWGFYLLSEPSVEKVLISDPAMPPRTRRYQKTEISGRRTQHLVRKEQLEVYRRETCP